VLFKVYIIGASIGILTL